MHGKINHCPKRTMPDEKYRQMMLISVCTSHKTNGQSCARSHYLQKIHQQNDWFAILYLFKNRKPVAQPNKLQYLQWLNK